MTFIKFFFAANVSQTIAFNFWYIPFNKYKLKKINENNLSG